MDVEIKILCSTPGCEVNMKGKDKVYCNACVKTLKDKVTELENQVYDLEKYIEKEEL